MNRDIVCIGAGYIGGPIMAVIAITDPKAIPNARSDLADISDAGRAWTPAAPQIDFIDDPYAAAENANAVLRMTDWALYPTLDWQRIYDSMRKPALVFDTRNCLDVVALRDIGFKVLSIGK